MTRPLPPVIGTACAVLSDVGPGYELIAAPLPSLGLAVEVRPGAGDNAGDDTSPPATSTETALRAIARRAFREACGLDLPDAAFGLRLGFAVGVGLGASAAAAAAGARAGGAAAYHLGHPVDSAALLRAACLAEEAATGRPRAHAVAAALHGRWAVAHGHHPPDTVTLQVPDAWALVAVTPSFPLGRAAAKRALPDQVHLMKAVRQAGAALGLVDGLRTGDADRVARHLQNERIVAHALTPQVPGLGPALLAATDNGAFGAWISGGGPTVAALCPDPDTARDAAAAIADRFRAHALDAEIHTS